MRALNFSLVVGSAPQLRPILTLVKKEIIKTMKKINQIFRFASAFLAIAMLFLSGFSARSLANSLSHSAVFVNAEKHVQITIEIEGDIDGHTEESVEHLIIGWLEAAHFVVSETDGAGFLHLHIKLDVTDNHHFKVHSDCADWHEDKEAAVVGAIDEILHHMIADFIEKYMH
jgi:hypothetical protein